MSVRSFAVIVAIASHELKANTVAGCYAQGLVLVVPFLTQ